MSGLILAFEQSKMFGRYAIKVQACDRLSVIIIQQNRAIRLGISDHYTSRIGYPGGDRLNDMKSRDLLWGRHHRFFI